MRWLWLFLCFLVACGDDAAPMMDAGSDATSFDASTDATVDVGTDAALDAPVDPTVSLPRTAIDPSELAVIVNDADAQSVALGDAYIEARGLDPSQLFVVTLPDSGAVLPATDFTPIHDALQADLDAMGAQAIALTWTQPYRVGCMSITTAFALGFDDAYCNTSGMSCGGTAPIDYFDSSSTRPLDDHGLRPTMMLAATDTENGEALIARGVASDDTFPDGNGWLVRTTDMARSVRWPTFQGVVDQWSSLDFTFIDNADGSASNVVSGEEDVLFYFTGLARVADIDTNAYRPGAIADHLTSFGGRVPTSGQMSVVEWLEAGVTGSYGTVVEPCNFTQKFPVVPVVIERYFRGETLVEAYWKSVRWPGEGLFVGEPLARPFGAQSSSFDGATITIESNAVVPDETWVVEAADSEDGPWRMVLAPTADAWERQTIEIPHDGSAFYRLRREDP